LTEPDGAGYDRKHMRTASIWLFSIALAGCAAKQTNPELGVTRNPPPEPKIEDKPKKPPVSKLDPDVVERAAMAYYGVRAADGKRFPPEELLRELAKADLICVGEDHDNPHHHWAELSIVRGLVARAPMRAREVGIGLEMIQRPYQAQLDKYMSMEIEEEELVDNVEWHSRWGYDWAYYRPVLELGRRARLSAVALNAPRELSQKVAREGLDAISDEEEKRLPELDLSNEEHRAWFDRATKDHPGGDRDRMYAAQVLWDETMADTAARWLKTRSPARQLVVLAGAGHCNEHALPARAKRRIAAKIISVRPVVQKADGDPAAALEGFDYAFVMTPDD
jgi:uncharacterized iron-regulated protein